MKGKNSYLLKFVMFLICMALVLLPITASAAKDPIRFMDLSWDSIQVHNRIAGFIIENGYGYGVEYIPGETIPLFTGLMRGNVDVDMESWTENIQEVYDKGIRSGKVLDLGSNYPDSWQGWLVPTFVIKGDPKRGIKPMAPGLKSVSDLPKYWKVFKDPENPNKGRFYNSIPGWKVTEINSNKLKAYGLDKYYEDFLPGSDAALSGSMVAAVKKGKPWVGYYWAPTWILGKLDMTALEEPSFDQKIWDTTKACAFKSVQVNILVNSTLAKRAPDVVKFFRNYETTTALNNKVLSYMQKTKASTGDAAIWFLKNYEGLWTTWVPADVAKKVKAAMK
ncbi:MAG: ABC transporter substrate-binding protein [Syntrophobacterales bacterium]|nr:ABC transporter substrate-binding protein [Syntrophobacterales bacterium]